MIVGPYSVQSILAEHVRTEQNNRNTIIGTYPLTVKLKGGMPVALPLGIFLSVQPVPPIDTQINIRLVLNGNTIMTLPSDTPKEGDRDKEMASLTLTISGPPLSIIEDSKFELFMKIGDLDEAKVGLLNISCEP